MPRMPINFTVGDWMDLLGKVKPEATAGAPHLEHVHAKLLEHLGEVQRLLVERNLYESRKQEATRKINEILSEGRRAATLLRLGLKQKLGPGNEQLAAFGIQPFRGRKRRSRKAKAEESPETGDATNPQPPGDPSA